MATKTAHPKHETVPVVQTPGTDPVKPSDLAPLDMSDKRAYQTTSEPGQREMLTKDEAQKRGLHWAEPETESETDTKRKRR